jgi:acyl-CoA thioesterase-1
LSFGGQAQITDDVLTRRMSRTATRALIAVTALVAAIAVGAAYLYRTAGPMPPTLRAEGIRVIAVGDSITYGLGVADPDEDSYPAQLQDLLGPEYQVLNYGVSGRTLQDSGDAPYRDTAFYPLTLEVDPHIVLIMLGTNDSKPQNWDAEDFERQLTGFVQTYEGLPSGPEVYLMTPPAAFADGSEVDADVVEIEIRTIVRSVGEQTNTPVIDVFAATRDHPEYFPDGVHPNEAGARRIAEEVLTALEE